jgi:hypothetical protein
MKEEATNAGKDPNNVYGVYANTVSDLRKLQGNNEEENKGGEMQIDGAKEEEGKDVTPAEQV